MTDLTTTGNRLRIGFFLNPYAGVGGPEGLKGSDASEIQAAAAQGQYALRAAMRAATFWQKLKTLAGQMDIFTVTGKMGGDVLDEVGLTYQKLDCDIAEVSTADDSKKAVQQLQQKKIDLLLFVGGDGTARDVCAVVEKTLPVLGIPSGVKMHSGVFGISPSACAELIEQVLHNRAVRLTEQEVRDIDEEAFRSGIVKSRYYGEMLVPADDRFVQQVKQGGGEEDEMSLIDIRDEIQERMDDHPDALFIFGPGSTTDFIKKELGLESTLLGVDLVENQTLIKKDCNAKEIYAFLQGNRTREVFIILTAIGGQGHLIGRGNQQLTPEVLTLIGKEHVWPVLTRAKLRNLQSRPLLIDSGDETLDQKWSGLIPVITGYQETLLYRLDYLCQA